MINYQGIPFQQVKQEETGQRTKGQMTITGSGFYLRQMVDIPA